MDMDISMDIHAKSVDMDMDMDGKFHIHGNPGFDSFMAACCLAVFRLSSSVQWCLKLLNNDRSDVTEFAHFKLRIVSRRCISTKQNHKKALASI